MFGNFYPDAADVLADPNGHLIISDGRNHVELTDRTYDIIVVDPPPPVQGAGVSVISSREFYEAAKARLNPDGIMMQWVPYDQTLDEFKAHVRTLTTSSSNTIVAAGRAGSATRSGPTSRSASPTRTCGRSLPARRPGHLVGL
jgi:spermidine synthase